MYAVAYVVCADTMFLWTNNNQGIQHVSAMDCSICFSLFLKKLVCAKTSVVFMQASMHQQLFMLLLLLTGFQYYSDSPFGKSHHFTIFFSSVRCIGNEARITDCATSNLTFEEGKKLVNHIGVAGVSCKPNILIPSARMHPSV